MIDQRRSDRQKHNRCKYIAILLCMMVALVVLVDVQATQTQATFVNEVAYFRFDVPPVPETFVFRSDDPAVIQEARDVLNGNHSSRMIIGTIVKQPRDYNAPWSYHLDPASVRFADNAVEVCDATIQFVEDHLAEICGATLPDCEWCPWSSRVIAEVAADTTPTPTPIPTATPTVVVPPTRTPILTPTPSPEPEYLHYLPFVARGK